MPDRTPQERYRALLTGINFYRDSSISDLRFAVNDAQELQDVLISPPYGFVSSQLAVLKSSDSKNDKAMRRSMLRELRRLARSVQDGDWLLFYYSGHGTVVHSRPYLCPSDTETGDLLEDTAIPLAQVREIIEASAATVRILILDACHLGARIGAKEAFADAQEFAHEAKHVFQNVRGIALLASSALEEISIEVKEREHGIFTYYLLEALRNQHLANRDSDTRLSVIEVFDYVASRLQSHGQQPTILLEGHGDLTLFHLPESTSQSNPVRRVFPSPVKAPKDFFGRTDELRVVGQTLLHTSDILIFIHGERCIGKTSFISRIKSLLDETSSPDARYLHSSIEPSGIRTVEDFAREMWDGLQGACRTAVPSEYAEYRPISFRTFSQFLIDLDSLLHPVRNSRIVIFLDEFDKLRQATDDVTSNQIIDLVRYVIEQSELPVAFVVSSLKDQESFWSSFGSPPSWLPIPLSPLDRGECDLMLASFFSESTVMRNHLFEQIFICSGGQPYFAKLLAAEVFDILAQGTSLEDVTSSSGWERLLDRAVKTSEVVDVFKFYYEYFSDDERHALLSISVKSNHEVSGQEVANWRLSHRVAASHLERRRYLIPLADGGYRLRLQLLGRWLNDWPGLPLEYERLGLTSVTTFAISPHGICIDERTSSVYVGGRLIEANLPNLQYEALLHMARNSGRVITREELYRVLHSNDETYLPTDQSLDALVYRLRVALDDKEQRHLKTVRNRGFLLTQATVIPRRRSPRPSIGDESL